MIFTLKSKSTSPSAPVHRLRAYRAMMGLSLIYLIFGIGVASYASLGKGVWGAAATAKLGAAPSLPSIVIAELLLFAVPALLLFFGSRALLKGKLWGRLAGMLVSGLLILVIFPYGAFVGGFLLWTLIAGWELPKRWDASTLPRAKVTLPEPKLEPKPMNPELHKPWLTDKRIVFGKRAKPRRR